MTALPVGVLDPIRRFHQIPVETINEVLDQYDPEDHDGGYACRQTRVGEDTDGVSGEAEIRAMVCHPGFWRVAAEMPNNAIYWPVRENPDGTCTPPHRPKAAARPGAPMHFPDYLMLLAACIASTSTHRTHRAALRYLSDPQNWAHLVYLIDQYVPDGWTRLGELPSRSTVKQDKRRARLRLVRGTPGGATPPPQMSPTNHGGQRTRLYPVPDSQPPQIWHFKNWARRFYGKTKTGQPLPAHDPYSGLRQRLLDEFRSSAIDQAQDMGLIEPGLKMFVRNPRRDQFVGTDGVVFACKNSETTCTHSTGAGPMTGTKYGIFSTRVSGERHTRLIFDFANITKGLDGSFNDESAYILERLPILKNLSDDGIKGVLVDSAVRGKAVATLQRQDICVVNYPHAESNPNGGPGRRLNPTRREKSHLRTTLTHTDAQGFPCSHPIFAVGGDFLELVIRPEHEDGDLLKRVTRRGYHRRGRPGHRREYLKIKITCPRGSERLTHLMPLFHTDRTSSDPDYNWGEVSRVFAPGTAEFAYLYGQRNDTEARHAELKRRIAYMPKSVAGQELRLLGAALAINAVALQAHRRHHEHPNVLDDTA